jgi:DNA-binding CsgD family transcriptional regulator
MEFRFLAAATDQNMIARDMVPVIGAIGTSTFEQALLSMARGAAQCTHLTAFSHPSSSASARSPRVLVAVNWGGAPIARRLATKYIQSYWNLDPANNVVGRRARVGRGATLRLQSFEIENAEYRRDCYRSADLIDRFSVIKRLGDEIIRLNFYRETASGRFSDCQLAVISTMAELAIVAIGKHDALSPRHTQADQYNYYCRRLSVGSASLSSREIQVCAQIVLGLHSKAIANKLGLSVNTILSHRRRAYAKLKISRQSELFHLLLN